MGVILIKNIFLPKLSNIQQNYALLLFWSILEEIHRELLFLDQKVTISERRTEILTKFVFLNMFENGQILRKIWICLNNSFWSNQWKGTIIKKNCFSLHTVPHTAKLCFSVVLMLFRGNSQRTSLFSPKMTISARRTKILRKFVSLNMFENGQILRKIWICLNNSFWWNSKRQQILTKPFFHLKMSHIHLNCALLLF